MSVHSDEDLIKLKSTLAEVLETSSLILLQLQTKIERCFIAARIIAYFQIAHKNVFKKRDVSQDWPRLKIFLGVCRSFSLTITNC